MSHFNVPFVFGYFSSWFLQCIPFWSVSFESKCLAALRTKAYTAQLLYRGGPYIIFIPKPEYWPRHLGCDWCRPAVAFWKYSFRSCCPDICSGWRIYGPWRKPTFCGKDKGLHTCPGENKEASTSCRSWKSSWCSPWLQPKRASTLWTVDLDLGNKAMLANPFTLTGKRNSQI